MSAAPVVSVVLTTYNQGQWLKQAIDSVRTGQILLLDEADAKR